MRRVMVAIFFMVVYTLPGLAQPRNALTLNDISDLIKNGVRPNRIAQIVEERGVGFELDDRALRRLNQDGANETVLAAVKKMSARYTEERQQARRQQEEEARRKREKEAKRREDQKLQQAKITEATRRPATAASLSSSEAAGRVVSLRNVMSTEAGEVSGEVVNNSKQTLRDIRLQILYSWRWKNEYQPGKDDPGKAIYHVLQQEIPPGQTVRFNYEPSPPFASREDGQFDIGVKVVGFAQVFPGSALK